MSRVRSNRAFTLVELLSVIGIIAVLIGLLMPAIGNARDRSAAVQCQAHLRELFAAQTFYANENGGRFAGREVTSDDRWDARLSRYLQRGESHSRLTRCPSAEPDPSSQFIESYGVNSCMNMPNWQLRRDRKMNASRIIVMGEKSATLDDYLTTEDGYFLLHWGEAGVWYKSIFHSGAGAARHFKGAKVNMVMADGHVEAIPREELKKDSGRWYWGKVEGIPIQEIDQGACCP